VYLRVGHSSNDFRISLICAKTKLAPVKTLSIPRLELNAVVLLNRLLAWATRSLHLSNVSIYGWTDSTIVLAWLRQHPSTWKTYVANRVSEIQTSSLNVSWNHVPLQENPADCASRGLSATALTAHEICWNEPSWLKNDSANWPKHDPAISTDAVITERISAEARSVSTVLQVDRVSEWELPHRYSSWMRLTRITIYVRRFVANLRQKKHTQTNKKRLPIQVSELNEAAEF